jgi:hypothetical protein
MYQQKFASLVYVSRVLWLCLLVVMLVGMPKPEAAVQIVSFGARTGFGTSRNLVSTTASTAAQFSQQGPKLVGTGAVGNAQQGHSVSISSDGNTTIVGGPSDNIGAGAAWVWTRSGGAWTQQGSKLVGSGAIVSTFGASQGVSVSLSADGNTAIVGAGNDTGTWVWTRSGGAWTQQGPKLIPSDVGGFGFAGQGASVSLSADGNTAIIGGPNDNNNVGAAWVWTRSGGAWTQQGAKLVGSGSVGTSFQGKSVSLSADGNTAIVGGWLDNNQVGAAWVWTRSEGVWTQQGPKLVGTGAVGNAQQGHSVSLSADGNTAIIGGPGNGAWVWTRSGGVWTQQGPKLFSSDGPVVMVVQGYSVSLSADGNTAIVGGFTNGSLTAAAWAWTRSGGAWTQQVTMLIGSDEMGVPSPDVSVSLSADGNTAIIGGGSDQPDGAAWVFTASISSCNPIISVPNFKQFSSPWATDTYDHDPPVDANGKPNNIKRWGCFLTACVNVVNYQASRQGVPFSTDPRVLNTWLNGENDGYSGDAVNSEAVARYARQNGVHLYYQGVDNRNDSIVDSYLCSGNPILLKVPSGKGHFVTATGRTTVSNVGTYSINDPGHSGSQYSTLEGYGFDYLGIRKFSSTVRSPKALYVAAHSPVEFIVTDPNGKRTGFDSISGQIISEIPESNYTPESLGDDIDPMSGDNTPEVKQFELLAPLSGTYTVQVIGTGTGRYSLDLLGYNNDGIPSITIVSGNSSLGSIATYQIAYSPNQGVSLLFNSCIQDDSNGNRLQINTSTGEYSLTNCSGFTVGGTGSITKKGNMMVLQHYAPDRRVLAQIDTAIQRATASIQILSQGRMFTITDRNTSNNICVCTVR